MARVSWNGDAVRAAVRQGAQDGLRIAAEHLLGASRAIVPIDTGELSRSGRAEVDSARLEATVSYNTPYAVYQHERLDLHHKAGRKAKYLETPLRTQEQVLLQIISTAVQRRLPNG